MAASLKTLSFVLVMALVAGAARAETLVLQPTAIVEWKAVFGQVETRDRVPARARTGGTVVELVVSEGDRVSAGQRIAVVEDDKLSFQLDAIDARLEALGAQLDTASADLERGKQLKDRGVITAQRLDQLQTAFDVIDGEIRSLKSQRLITEQQVAEGEILAPGDGVVLSVPISLGSVITPGEAAAVIGGGGVFLRLAVPERYAASLAEGDEIEIAGGTGEEPSVGKLVKLYPEITGGRVSADVEVEGLDGRFVGRRVPVRLPVGERLALIVPETALDRHGGLDFVTVTSLRGNLHRVVVPGGALRHQGAMWREILTGLAAGDTVVLDHD